MSKKRLRGEMDYDKRERKANSSYACYVEYHKKATDAAKFIVPILKEVCEQVYPDNPDKGFFTRTYNVILRNNLQWDWPFISDEKIKNAKGCGEKTYPVLVKTRDICLGMREKGLL